MGIIIPREHVEFDKREFRTELRMLKNKLENKGTFLRNQICLQHSNDKRAFLDVMAYVDTFNWKDSVEEISWFYGSASKAYVIDRMENSENAELVIATLNKTDITRTERYMNGHEIRTMPVLQDEMRQNENHKLLITTKGASTYVLTTEELTWKNLFKTLIMHWEWHKDTMPTPNEDYINMLFGYYNADAKAVEDSLNNLVWNNEDLIREKLYADAKKLTFNKEYVLEKKEQEITETRYRMDEAVRQYEIYNTKFVKLNEEYEAIRCKDEKVDVEKIVDFIINNEYITLDSEADDVVLHYRAPIIDYDQEIAERQKDYRGRREQEILDIFIEHRNTYRMWVHAEVHMNVTHSSITALSRERFLNEGDRWYYGHPHLNEYQCLGNHPQEIIPFMNQGNFIGAINQITSMVFNLNFADGPVVNTLIAQLDNSIYDYKIWENTKTHTFMTTDEVLREIKENRNGTTETD